MAGSPTPLVDGADPFARAGGVPSVREALLQAELLLEAECVAVDEDEQADSDQHHRQHEVAPP
jgi:hypothetical protein